MNSSGSDRVLGEFVQSLCGIKDARQRSFALASKLQEMHDDEIIRTLKFIREQALHGHEYCLLLYNSLMISDVFTEEFKTGRLSSLVDVLQARCEYELVAILMDVPPEGQHDLPFQPFLDATLRETPLGMRKALARKPDVRLIKRIARDQDHRVIRNLLDNPRLTEMDVIKIGSTRPTSRLVLEVIYNHPKWISRHSIKRVIVLNPHSSLSMAVRLLTFMKVQDLEEVIQSRALNPLLLEEAGRILSKKVTSSKDEYTLEI
jgi:hypothetical protein